MAITPLSAESKAALKAAQAGRGVLHRADEGTWGTRKDGRGHAFNQSAVYALYLHGLGDYTKHKQYGAGRFAVEFTLKERS